MAVKNTREKYINAKNISPVARRSPVLNTKKYVQDPIDERFKQLMVLYAKLCPDWKQEYDKVERRKPREVRTPLEARNIIEVINGAIGDEIIEESCSMHVANKIAHQSERMERDIIKYFMESKVVSDNVRMPRVNTKEEEYFYDNIDIAISKSTSDNEKALAKKRLRRHGVTEKILEQLDSTQGDDIRLFSDLSVIGFFIKDFEMEKLIAILQKNENEDMYSYGKFSKYKTYSDGSQVYDDDGEPVMEHCLVVDLPYYGQFCVHMKTERSISALSQTPYDEMRIYETETVLLSDGISDRAAEYIDFKTQDGGYPSLEDIMPDLKNIRRMNPRFAHYLALKMGATKAEIDKLYDDLSPDNQSRDSGEEK